MSQINTERYRMTTNKLKNTISEQQQNLDTFNRDFEAFNDNYGDVVKLQRHERTAKDLRNLTIGTAVTTAGLVLAHTFSEISPIFPIFSTACTAIFWKASRNERKAATTLETTLRQNREVALKPQNH